MGRGRELLHGEELVVHVWGVGRTFSLRVVGALQNRIIICLTLRTF